MPRAQELPQLGLQAVVVAGPYRFAVRGLIDKTLDLAKAPREIAVPPARLPRERGERRESIHDAVDLRPAIEGSALPRGLEVPVIEQLLRGSPQAGSRPYRVGTACPSSEDPPHAFRGIRERALEPGVEGTVQELALLVLRCDLEERVHSGLDRALAQQVGTEAVDRPDVSDLELAECTVQEPSFRRRDALALPGSLDLRPQAELHLPGSLLGKGDRHDSLERRSAALEQGDDAGDELGRLPGSGRCFDEERGVEVLSDPTARVGVALRHGRPRSCSRSASSPVGLRAVRSSSYGPQTT